MKQQTIYYFAPMEGITTWIYRQAHAKVYGPLPKYFIPFLEPHEKRDFKTRELKEILPKHNEGICAVPQILTNRAEGFRKLADALKRFGYGEVNLNLGCPSRTVVSKGKGSGFLSYPEELDHFLEEIFAGTDLKISVKTRIGRERPEEFERLLEIYNKYPLEELIIHPRLQTDLYKGEPRRQIYREARAKSRNHLCYNGDLFTRGHIRIFSGQFPEEDRLMIGRGLLMDPGLLCEGSTPEQFREFQEYLLEGYTEQGLGDTNVLFKMKELWAYQIHRFSDKERWARKLRKVQRLSEYVQVVDELLSAEESGGRIFR